MKRTGILACILTLALVLTAVVVWTPGESRASTVIIADVAVDTTWTSAGGPYLIMSAISVKSPAILTIEPGANVQFDNGMTLTVESGAKLIAVGNESAGRIVFNASNPGNTWAGIILQSISSEITECNFTGGSPGVRIIGNVNLVSNSTFTKSPIGISISGKGNWVRNCDFKSGVDFAVHMSLANYNSVEDCRILGAEVGIDFATGSNNNYVNGTTIAGGDTSIAINGASNIQVNCSAMINNKYCIKITGTALLNNVKNSTLLVSTEKAITTTNPLDASGNYWGITDVAVIETLVTGAVDVSNPLAADPVGLGLPTIDTVTTWTTDQPIVGGLVVSSGLTVATSKITFDDPEGYNFIYVTGSLNLQGCTVTSAWESCTIFLAPGSTAVFSDTTVSNGFSILGYTTGLVFQGSTFLNGSTAMVLRNAGMTEISNCTFTDCAAAVVASGSASLVIKDNMFNDGVSLSGATGSVIAGNSFDTAGIAIASASGCSISMNNFSNAAGRALQLSSVTGSQIVKNTFYRNNIGVYLNPGCMGNNITNNEMVENSEAPVYISSTDGNFVYHNNIYGSFLYTSLNDGINYFNNSKDQGNYWSAYLGVDDGSDDRVMGDGKGDTFLPHLGVDNFPYVNPSGWLYPLMPSLDPLGPGVNTDGKYNVTWSLSENSEWYILHESMSSTFLEYTEVYNGTGVMQSISDQEAGTYYYRVRGENSMGFSTWSSAVSVRINFEPEVLLDSQKVNLDEDGFVQSSFNLTAVFSDPAGEDLDFSFEEPGNVTLELTNEGYINATAAVSDWSGEEVVRFYATDGMFTVNTTITFEVDAVNDPPPTPVITLTPSFRTLEHWELTNLSASCADVDTDIGNLTFTWESNRSGNLGEGVELLNLDLAPGVHEITLIVDDGEFTNSTTVEITKHAKPIVPPPPPPDDDDNTGTIVVILAVLVLIVLIVIGAFVYLIMRKKSIEAAEELSKEQAETEKQTKLKKIKKIEAQSAAEDAAMDAVAASPEGDTVGPDMGIADAEEIGPAVGPVMEEDMLAGDGDMDPDEKQKMLDELDELLFADEISEEEYINRVNEIENM